MDDNIERDRKIGRIQLAVVIAFILGSVLLSKIIGSGDYEGGDLGIAGHAPVVRLEKIDSVAEYKIVFSTTGIVKAGDIIQVIPEISGRVVSVHSEFRSGGSFRIDDVLFKVDDVNFRLIVQQLEAEVARAATLLKLEKASSRAALAEWEQLNPMKDPPDLVARKPQLQEASSLLKSARARLRKAEIDLQKTSFILPFDGRVLTSQVAVGQYLSAGNSYGTVFDSSELEVVVSLDEQQLEWLANSDDPEILISTDYLGQTMELQGVLHQSVSSLDANTRFATINLGFKGGTQDLIPGVFADVSISGGNVHDVMIIPIESLQTNGVVWVVEENKDGNLLELKSWIPEIVYKYDNYVVVRKLDKSINVVVSRIAGAVEGMQVTVDDDGQAANNSVTP